MRIASVLHIAIAATLACMLTSCTGTESYQQGQEQASDDFVIVKKKPGEASASEETAARAKKAKEPGAGDTSAEKPDPAKNTDSAEASGKPEKPAVASRPHKEGAEPVKKPDTDSGDASESSSPGDGSRTAEIKVVGGDMQRETIADLYVRAQ
jgi:hypothetical protein